MLTQRADDLRAIMIDNGTFINFPPVGSQASLISVYGDHRVNIQRTIRSIMQLACQFYVASFWLLPINFNVLMPASTVNPSHIPNVLKRIAMVSGAEVVFKSNCFEMHGLEHEVRSAVLMVLELDVVKVRSYFDPLYLATLTLIKSVIPPRDPIPTRTRQRTPRLHQR
jgi:hypothetical protein